MLTLFTLCYLALPYFLFAWGWLWWPYALLLTAALLVALAVARKTVLARSEDPADSRIWPSGRDGILLFLMTVLIHLPSGVGGIGYQREDWHKHNGILHDLTTSSWPVVVESNNDGSPRFYLAYYFGYYLPAGAVGRVFGLTAAHLALFVWTFIGMLLCARWITKLVPGWAPLIWAVWFALTGMDVVFGGILHFKPSGNLGDWWADYWQYSANYSLLIWVPQHWLPGWLITALIVNELERDRDVSLVGFAAGMSALWSPFVTIGLVPVVAAAALKGRRRTLWSIPNLVTGSLLILIAVAFLKTVEQDKITTGFIWEFYPWPSVAFRWPLFLLCEFGVYSLLIAPEVLRGKAADGPSSTMNRTWFWCAILFLSILPVFRLGEWNDLCMRASIPCLFLFWIVLLRTIFGGSLNLRSWRGALLIGCLLVSSAFPAKNWAQQVFHFRPWLQYSMGSADVAITDLIPERIPQYLGKADKFFFQHLAPVPTKLSVPVPKHVAPTTSGPESNSPPE
jgi:hypothetical protein